MADRFFDRRFEVGEVDRLHQKVEGAAIHRGADIGHVAIGRNDDRRNPLFRLLQLGQEREAVHARHVDVGQDEIHVWILGEH